MQNIKSGILSALKERFQNMTVTVSCTLEEFYFGCKKIINYEKIVVIGDGTRQKMELVQKEIHVKPGMGPHTQITFPNEGHQRVGQRASDLVINFKQLPHEKF